MTATISSSSPQQQQQQQKSMDSEIHKLLQRSHVELAKLPSSSSSPEEVVQFHKKQPPLSRQYQQHSSLAEAGGRSISAIFQHVSKNLDEKMIDEIASSDQKHQHRKFSKKDLTIALDMMSIFYEEQQKQESQQKKEQLLEQQQQSQPSPIAADVNAWKQKTRLLKQQYRKNRNRQKDSLFRKAHDFVLKQPNAGVVVLVASPTGSISTYTSIDPRQEKLTENAQTQQARLVQMMQIMWQLYAQTDLSTRHQQHVVDQTFQQQKTVAPESDIISACTLSSKQKSSTVHLRSYSSSSSSSSSNNHKTVEGIDNNERISEIESSSSAAATSSSAPQPSKKRRRMSWKQQQQQQLSSRIKDEEVIVRVDDIMSCLCNKCKQQPVIVEQFHLERDGVKVPSSSLPSRQQQQKASPTKKKLPLHTKKKSVAVIPMYEEEDEDGDDTMDDFVSSSSISSRSSGNSQRTVISDDMRPLSDLIRKSSSDSSDSEFDDESGYDSSSSSSSSSDTGG